MQNQTVLRRHGSLVDRMSDHLGVDLEEKVLRGDLAPDLIPDLVLRCTKCTNPEACEKLLATRSALEVAPDYCVNRETLENLR